MPLSTSQILIFAAFASAIAFGGCAQQPNQPQEGANSTVPHYPETRRVEQTDEYHGVKVADPYRWLEGDVRESPEVAEWVAKQNEVARAYLDAIPQRPQIMRRLTEIWNYERFSAPQQQGGKYFYLRNDGLQNQAVLFVADKYDADGRVLIDPNEWSKDGTIALAHYVPSKDGKLLAYSKAEAGSDWQQIFVLDVATGEARPDQLKWARFSDVSWTKDGSGFFYSRYPEPKEGEKFQAAAKNQMVYFHRLGDEQAEDRLVYARPDEPDWSFSVGPTDDGQYLVLTTSQGTDPQNQVYVRRADDLPAVDDVTKGWTELVGDFKNQFWSIGNDGTTFYFLTDLDASTKRIVTMDVERPGRENVREFVPAEKSTLEGASILSGQVITQYLQDVLTRVRVFDLAGKLIREVQMPGLGSAAGFGGDQDDTETFYTFSSYNTPGSIYRYDVPSGESKLVRRSKVKFDPEKYTVEEVFYSSKDGTRVPMMLAYRKDLARDRPQPTLLYGYGGFSISLAPHFSPDYAVWMEMGGVLAVANLRGGGEYGEDWHQAGKTLKKQNVFDDFIAAAERLVADGRTSHEKLAINGGSNGGLLVGAVMVQRPELFGACIPEVGVIDMLRFHQFTAGQFWRAEYGSADDPDQFKALYAYSPYHNIKDGIKYPATMIMTADTDDRVVPMHSFKFAAALQRAQAGSAPIILRVETRAGHGGGTPVTKRIDEAADRWAFLVKNLQMDVAVEN
jgi:prolyl oligopeptidase